MQREISDELRRSGVAASTIREALGAWIESETKRILTSLAQAPATLEALLTIKADAVALTKITRELDLAMNRGGVE